MAGAGERRRGAVGLPPRERRRGAEAVPALAAAPPAVSDRGRRLVFRLRGDARFGRREPPGPPERRQGEPRAPLPGGLSGAGLTAASAARARSSLAREGGIPGIVARDGSDEVEFRLSRPDPLPARAGAALRIRPAARDAGRRPERGGGRLGRRSPTPAARGSCSSATAATSPAPPGPETVSVGVPSEEALPPPRGRRLRPDARAPTRPPRRSARRPRCGATSRGLLLLHEHGWRAPFDWRGGQIDRRALAAAFGGQAAPTARILPPGVPGYRGPAVLPAPDLAAARQLVRQAVRPRGRDHLGLHPRAVADGHATPRPDAQRPRPALPPFGSGTAARCSAPSATPAPPRRSATPAGATTSPTGPTLPPPRGLVHPAGRQPQLRPPRRRPGRPPHRSSRGHLGAPAPCRALVAGRAGGGRPRPWAPFANEVRADVLPPRRATSPTSSTASSGCEPGWADPWPIADARAASCHNTEPRGLRQTQPSGSAGAGGDLGGARRSGPAAGGRWGGRGDGSSSARTRTASGSRLASRSRRISTPTADDRSARRAPSSPVSRSATPSDRKATAPPPGCRGRDSRSSRSTVIASVLARHDPDAAAGRADLGHDLPWAVGDVLARHLHEPERRDVDDVGPGAVAGEGLVEGRLDRAPVGLVVHVDEVDDHDAADVAQAQLADDPRRPRFVLVIVSSSRLPPLPTLRPLLTSMTVIASVSSITR